MNKALLFVVLLLAFTTAKATDLQQQFKDPTFSGTGWTSQVLTLQQMEMSAKAQVAAKQAADQAAAQAAAANTPLARFLALFTSQVYSQLATQLTNNLFSSCKAADGSAIPGCSPASSGTFNIDPTTTVSWHKTPDDPAFGGQTSVTLTIVNTANPSQNTTITVPIASFGF
jgi:hypothetical protein